MTSCDLEGAILATIWLLVYPRVADFIATTDIALHSIIQLRHKKRISAMQSQAAR